MRAGKMLQTGNVFRTQIFKKVEGTLILTDGVLRELLNKI